VDAVAFAHIDRSFGAVAALRDVTFAVARGESHAIVGENGAGKSTCSTSSPAACARPAAR